jgi:tRNA threonylcarbamoyladenosine modification (KEOPS) complex  Pcc1 subunit
MYRSGKTIKAKVTISLDSDLLDSVRLALEPETSTPSSDRSTTSIDVAGELLVINTDADDVSALRANLNSYLRWVDGIQGIIDGLE